MTDLFSKNSKFKIVKINFYKTKLCGIIAVYSFNESVFYMNISGRYRSDVEMSEPGGGQERGIKQYQAGSLALKIMSLFNKVTKINIGAELVYLNTASLNKYISRNWDVIVNKLTEDQKKELANTKIVNQIAKKLKIIKEKVNENENKTISPKESNQSIQNFLNEHASPATDEERAEKQRKADDDHYAGSKASSG